MVLQQEDPVRDPTIEAAFNRAPCEMVASLSLILASVMLVAHTYNHISYTNKINVQINIQKEDLDTANNLISYCSDVYSDY